MKQSTKVQNWCSLQCCKVLQSNVHTLNNQVSLRHINAPCSHICCLWEKYITDTYMVHTVHTDIFMGWYFMKGPKLPSWNFATFIFATYNSIMVHVLHWQCSYKAECWMLGKDIGSYQFLHLTTRTDVLPSLKLCRQASRALCTKSSNKSVLVQDHSHA